MNNYVYVYLDPRKPGDYNYGEYHFDYEPFYVGKGYNNRAYDHLKGNKYNPHLSRKISKIQKECNPYITIYKEELNENDAFKLEIEMIKSIGRYNLKQGPLCNLTSGGEGLKGYIPTEECIKRNSESHIGIKKTDETKLKMKKPKGPQSIEHRSKIGKIHSNWWTLINPNGEIFKIFNLREFCRNNNLSHQHMNAISKNKRNNHKGWKCYKLL